MPQSIQPSSIGHAPSPGSPPTPPGVGSGPACAALAILYGELRALAVAQMRSERGGHTLQPTALVHEAFLKVCGRGGIDWSDRTQVLATSATAMRRILVDHARAAADLKRGGAGRHGLACAVRRQALDPDQVLSIGIPCEDLLAVDEALTSLAAHDDRLARVVELRYFAGLSVDETAEIIGVSPRTVDLDFRAAKAWLRCALDR